MRLRTPLAALTAVLLLTSPAQLRAQSFTGPIGGAGFSTNLTGSATATNYGYQTGDFFQQIFSGTGLSSASALTLNLNIFSSLNNFGGIASQLFTASVNGSAVGTYTLTSSTPGSTSAAGSSTFAFTFAPVVAVGGGNFTLRLQQTGPSVYSGGGSTSLSLVGSSATLSTGVTATPEPASLVLLGTGLAGLFGVARRRQQQG